MRTTLTLDDDLLEQVKLISKKDKKPFKVLINQVIRVGLQSFGSHKQKKFKTKPRSLGLQKGIEIDNIADVLDNLD